MRVLILGGYGTFGGRIAELLAGDVRVALIIAGRSKAKAEAFIATLPLQRQERMAVALDRGGDLGAAFSELMPYLVVDASGPFQAYGVVPYGVVEACLAAGASYLDLADGAGFVAGMSRFDESAKRRGFFILSGMSSYPVLTSGVVRGLAGELDRVDSVTAGIAPVPYAGVGLNVIRAIASYAGKPVIVRRDGRETTGYALTETMRFTIAPPGQLPLKSRLFSLVDVPDLWVLPMLWPSLRSAWAGAGPVPEIFHRALIGLAWLVGLKLVPALGPLAGFFHRVINRLSWGEHRGGMFVRVTGEKAGESVERSWHLLAEGNDGPMIPSMAAAAIVQRCLAGNAPPPGARPGAADIELGDYETLFVGRRIVAGVRETSPHTHDTPLYRRILGPAYDNLPPAIQALHELKETMTVSGRADIDRGTGWLARLTANTLGFPAAGRDVPVTVQFQRRGRIELWRRVFATHSFASTQEEGMSRLEHLIVERFGPLAVALAAVVDGPRLRLVVRAWRLFGIPLPLALAPCSDAYEAEEDGRFRFHVEIGHPLTGLIVRYRGWLVPS